MSHKHHRNVRWTTRTVYFYSAQKQLQFAALWSSFAPPFSRISPSRRFTSFGTRFPRTKPSESKRFSRAWVADGEQLGLWPGELRLDSEFYESLVRHGLPLDKRAVRVSKNWSITFRFECGEVYDIDLENYH